MAKPTVIRVDAKLTWQCFRAKGGHWLGVCHPLKLTVQADTWGDLMEDIANTLDAMLKDLLKSDELQSFLRDRGWSVSGKIPAHPRNVHFDVPFLPAMMGEHGSSRSLHQ